MKFIVYLALCYVAIVLLWMALQFALMRRVNRDDPAPAPTAAQLLGAWWAESRLAFVVFAWRQPFRAQAVPDRLEPSPQRGVVLVHGFLCNRGFWNPWLRLLQGRGHACAAVTLRPLFCSIDEYAAQIDAAVRRVAEATGRAPVLVCHSMGGLAARAWLRAVPDADARVHRVLTLGTPHGGTWGARWSRQVNGQQMQLDSAWLRDLAQSEPPGRRARFVCWYSNCDSVVFPAGTAQLAGADNRFIAGVAHVQMAFTPEVVHACLAEIGRDD